MQAVRVNRVPYRDGPRARDIVKFEYPLPDESSMARPDLLVVDDERHILRAVMRVLGDSFEVVVSEDPHAAVEILKTHKPKVLITDFRMPGLDGVGVLRAACRHSPETVRILMTGQADRAHIIEAINEGRIFRFVAKPWQNEALFALVQEAMQAHESAREGSSLRGQVEFVGEIQRAILPRTLDTAEARTACSATPYEFASGDYVDTVALPGRRTAILVGDVSGHGLGAAVFVFTARALLRSGLQEGGSLVEVLERANRFLSRDMGDGRFLTLFAAIHNAESGELSYVNAGHVPAYVLSRERMTECPRTALPMGLFENTPYGNAETVAFAPTETLLACTDGVIEARDADGELFGMERLVQTLESGRQDGPEQLLERIGCAVRDFGGGVGVDDDLTLLAYRPEQAPTPNLV